MKFLCVQCDRRMDFAQRDVPGDGTLAAVFECPGCGRAVAMLTNPMETELVSSLGVKIGGREVPPDEPMESTRAMIPDARDEAFGDDRPDVRDDRAAGRGDDGARPATGERAGSAGDEGAGKGGGGGVEWSAAAERRLDRVPSFVRGMVYRIYTDWAAERDIELITPEVMDRARSDLGLEGM